MSMLVFLVIVIVLLLKTEDPDDFTQRQQQKEIPNPEHPLPPSHSKLFKFKHAAISSDSQTCSDITR